MSGINAMRRRQSALPDLEYVPEKWSRTVRGWDTSDTAAYYKAEWAGLDTAAPFGPRVTAYACSFLHASHQKSSMSILDWGGGIGSFLRYSQAIRPDLAIDYHCKEVPAVAEYGRTLLPEAHFHVDDSCLDSRYDFAVAQGSISSSQDWSTLFVRLARCSDYFYLYLPITQAASHVVLQRAHQTEFLKWILNEAEFMTVAASCSLSLVRSFKFDTITHVLNSPGPHEPRGYLFGHSLPS